MFCNQAIVLVLFLLGATAAQGQLRYEVELSEDARRLRVSMCTESALPAGRMLSGSSRAREHLGEIRIDGQRSPDVGQRDIPFAPLAKGDCIRYAVDAFAIASADRHQLSWREGSHVMLPIEQWLWRPARIPPASSVTLSLPVDWAASLPLPPIASRRHAYWLTDTPAFWGGTSAFGRFNERRIELPGGVLRLAILPTASENEQRRLTRWVERTAPVLLAATGRMPLPDVQVLVVPLPGVSKPVPWGQVSRAGGSAVKLFVGLDASSQALLDDWTLAHELSHLLHPYLHTRGRWLSEGLASYYQNVLRARVGLLAADQAWRRLDAGFGRGQRERGSAGRTLSEAASGGYRSTMRVYWSGAAFWLEAELALRQQGKDLGSLLHAFAGRHLPATRRWSPEAFVAELDRLADVELLLPMFERYANGTAFPSLDEVYRELGLGQGIGHLMLDDAAPSAAIREAIMQGLDR